MNETKRNERTNETKRMNETKPWLNAAYPSAWRRLVRFPKRLCSTKRRRMVSHERPTAIETNDLKARRPNPVSAWGDFDPPEKKQISEAPEAKAPFTHSADQVPVFFEDDWLMELLNMGSQPAGAFQEHEDTQPLHSFQEDGGTHPTETLATCVR